MILGPGGVAISSSIALNHPAPRIAPRRFVLIGGLCLPVLVVSVKRAVVHAVGHRAEMKQWVARVR